MSQKSTKPTLYIIHGWTYTTAHWQTTLDILKRDGYPTVMLKVPGLTTPSTKVWTITDYVSWADRNLPAGSIALGHSNGGRILMNLLSYHPRKLSHLILLSSAGIHEPSKKRDIIRFISKLGSPLKRIPFLRKVFHKLTGSTDYSHAPANMKSTLTNMLESDRFLHPEHITVPTSIIWGAKDTTTPLRMGEKLHSLIKNSTLEIHQSWTHAPYICDPSGLAKSLERIIDSIAEQRGI